MNNKHLTWSKIDEKEEFACRVFTIHSCRSQGPDGKTHDFTIMNAPDWVIVIPLVHRTDGDCFLMVHQWRHGDKSLGLEFPGGVIEMSEEALLAAQRELHEETGWKAGKLKKLGEFNPNPAIMANRVHIFLAEDLKDSGLQHLDTDEYIDVKQVPVHEVIRGMGRPPYVHALMASALMLYLRLGKGA